MRDSPGALGGSICFLPPGGPAPRAPCPSASTLADPAELPEAWTLACRSRPPGFRSGFEPLPVRRSRRIESRRLAEAAERACKACLPILYTRLSWLDISRATLMMYVPIHSRRHASVFRFLLTRTFVHVRNSVKLLKYCGSSGLALSPAADN